MFVDKNLTFHWRSILTLREMELEWMARRNRIKWSITNTGYDSD